MAGFLGMETEQVQQHADILTRRANDLDALGGQLSRMTVAIAWIGPDADAFRHQTSSVIRQLTEWTGRCSGSSADLRDHVSQQDQASGPDGGAGRTLSSWASGAAVGAAIGGSAAGTGLGGAVVSDIGPRLGAALGSYDDPSDDIAPITVDDISRPEDPKDPTSIAEMMDNLDAVGNAQEENSTTVRVQQVLGADGQTRYIVYVPGSHGAMHNIMGPDATGNPMDWNQNPPALGGQETDSSQAVIAAMEAAGIPHGADVSLVAHSQAGIVASNLAADPSVNGAANGWDISNVVSVGSPVERADVPSSTTTINFAHEPELSSPSSPVLADIAAPFRGANPVGDVVPTLDGDEHTVLGTPSNRHEVGLPAPTSDPTANHDVQNYRDSIAGATGEDRDAISKMENNSSMKQNLEDGTVVDTVDVSVSRADGTYEEQKSLPEIITDQSGYGEPFVLPVPGVG